MKPTLAVVEDNPDNRLLVHAILEDRYDLVEYETGAAALEGLRASPPDLVLLDISLPVMDGTEVLRRMKADPSLATVPVIALTAHAMAGDREKYLAQGFDDYVTKPIVDESVLVDAIERGLSGKR
jgi:two-component system, cell cycle response regulator DivK